MSGATLRGGFYYTELIVGDDIRRMPSVTVRKNLNNTPGTCTFTIDGRGAPPKVGEDFTITDGDVLLFTGVVQSVEQSFEDDPINTVWAVTAVDYVWFLNKRRPFGTYTNVSASLVVQDLMTRFAPSGFTTDFVQTSLAPVTVVFDGSEDFSTCLSRVARLLGEGHWYLRGKALHFFHTPITDTLSGLVSGPGTALTAAESATGGSPTPGYYYFQSSFVRQTAATFNPTPGAFDVSPPAAYVKLSNEAADLNLQGQISNGTYFTGVFFHRGWVGYDATGNHFVGAPFPPSSSGAVYYASPDVAAVLERVARQWVETDLSPISNVLKLTGNYLPALSSIPVDGDPAAFARRIYVTAFTEGQPSRIAPYAEILDNVTTAITTAPVDFTTTKGPKAVSPPAGPSSAPSASASATQATLITGAANNYAAGSWAFAVSFVYPDGTESALGPASGAIKLTSINAIIPDNQVANWMTYQADVYGQDVTPIPFTGTLTALLQARQAKFNAGGYYSYTLLSVVSVGALMMPAVTFANLPLGPAVNGLSCAFRKIWAAVHPPPPTAGTPGFSPDSAVLWGIVPDNTTTAITLAGGLHDAAGPTVFVDGPYLETADPPDDLDDINTTLLLNPPIRLTRDLSQIRNRVFVKGAGTTLLQPAEIGATALSVADASNFSGAGQLFLGSEVYRYAGITAIPGGATIYLKDPVIFLAESGAKVSRWVQVDDFISQQELGAAELDENGLPTDGVHEALIEDARLTTKLVERGRSELEVFSRPASVLTYATRDPKSTPGQTVHVNLTHPPIAGDFLIQEVAIDQIRDEFDEQAPLTPRYTVVATASPKYTFEDLLLDLEGRSEKEATDVVGLAASAAAGAVIAGGTLAVATLILTIDQLRSCFTKPVTVIPGTAGKVTLPVAVYYDVNQATASSLSQTLQLVYKPETSAVITPAITCFTSGAPTTRYQGTSLTAGGWTTSGQRANAQGTDVVVKANADFTSGSGTVTVAVAYIQLDSGDF